MDIKFNLDKIAIYIEPNFNWLPPHLLDKYYLALHSPKMIPEFKIGTNFIEVKPGISTVTYCKMKIDKKYESNCHDYEHDNGIRSDCVTICVMKNLQNVIGDVKTIEHSLLLRKEYFSKIEKFNITRIKKFMADPFIEIREQCLKQCKEDCSFSYYLYDITSVQTTSTYDTYKLSTITIQHNHIPDVCLRHLPETTFISFISCFGGLLGMWLGINALLIFDKLFLVSKITLKNFSKSKPRPIIIHRPSYTLSPIYNHSVNNISNHFTYNRTNLYSSHKRS